MNRELCQFLASAILNLLCAFVTDPDLYRSGPCQHTHYRASRNAVRFVALICSKC